MSGRPGARRGHLSTKIPNVKIRPAPASAASTRTAADDEPRNPVRYGDEYGEAVLGSDGEDEDEAGGVLDRAAEKPFAGWVLCCTGSINKVELFKKAVELGARTDTNLTDTVTHLIANEPGSAKYKCALALKLPILLSTFVDSAYETWLSGGTVHIPTLLTKHALLPFSNLIISMTGVEPPSKRVEMERVLVRCGATYSKNLDRRCTHLVSAREGGDKVAWARRHNAQLRAAREKDREAGGPIVLVWEEWVWACVQAGGLIDESVYDLSRPRPHPPKPSPAPTPPDPSKPSLLAEDSVLLPSNSNTTLPAKRPAPASAADEPERAVLKKHRIRASEVITGILSQVSSSAPGAGAKRRRPSEGEDGSATEDDEDEGSASVSALPPTNTTANNTTLPPTSRLLSSRSTSFAPSKPSDFPPASNTLLPPTPAPAPVSNPPLPAAAPESVPAIFAGLTFVHRGFEGDQPVRLERELHLYGGRVVREDAGEKVDWVVVAFSSGEKYLNDLPAPAVTECWVERCQYERRVIPADERLLFKPVSLPSIPPDTRKWVFTFSGVDLCERAQIMRLFRRLGFQAKEGFTKHITHVVTGYDPPAQGERYHRALERGVTVLRLGWVWQMVKEGNVPDTGEGSQWLVEGTGPHTRVEGASMLSHDTIPPSVAGTGPSSRSSRPNSAASVPTPGAPPKPSTSTSTTKFAKPDPPAKRARKPAPSNPFRATCFHRPSSSRGGSAVGGPSRRTSVSANESADGPPPAEEAADDGMPPPLPAKQERERERARSAGPLSESLMELLKKEGDKPPAPRLPRKRQRLKREPTGPSSRSSPNLSSPARPPSPPSRRSHSHAPSSPLSSAPPCDDTAPSSDADADETMRITYDDPVARREKRRILRVLEQGTQAAALPDSSSFDPLDEMGMGRFAREAEELAAADESQQSSSIAEGRARRSVARKNAR